MDAITQLVNENNWIWFVSGVVIFTIGLIFVMMNVTDKMERRHREEFEQEFTGKFKPVPVEDE